MADVCLILFHITVFFLLIEIGHSQETNPRSAGASAPGHVIIGGIFPVHQAVEKSMMFEPHVWPCVRFGPKGLAKAVAMINAIETMNKSPLLADINITLGYQIHDSCGDVTTGLRATADLIQQAICNRRTNISSCEQPVIAVVGASYSEISIAIARQLTLPMIPQCGHR
ncbi:G-protein coupled receptor family C group 6 member A-like [Thalassophryne amazonica]|uniref:G-protein coupled receptor family C group 6 member A-like n=1 Tax=Thalassophryne amazonica TaxID=390379 RepID=UPI001471A67C|nr:G-protein coupled receptor family C group 6 member A-like [Thalassophryne amazonica]